MFTIKKTLLIFCSLVWVMQPAAISYAEPTHAHSKVKHVKHTKTTHKVVKKKTRTVKHPRHISHVRHSKKTVIQSIRQYDQAAINSENDFLNLTQAKPPTFVVSMEQKLVGFIQKSVSSLRYSSYKLGGSRVDTTKGIYIVDCSSYVDYTLRSVFPNAYTSLVDWSGSEKPNSLHYYNFFKGLSEESKEYWSKVEDIEQLRPGDILVFRYKKLREHNTAGHVMVVMNKPQQDGDNYLLSVADSAPIGHSQDTRQAHVSGIGIGTILLKVNPKTGQPAAYAWRVGSRFKNNVNIAMARPSDVGAESYSSSS